MQLILALRINLQHMLLFRKSYLLILAFIFAWACSNNTPEKKLEQEQKVEADPIASNVLHLYTSQYLPADDTLFQVYEQQTGISVKVIEVEQSTLIAEIQSGKAIDVAIFPELGLVMDAKEAGLLQTHSPKLDNYHKSMARDDYAYWTGLSRKYPCVAYAKERLELNGLKDFWGLAETQWKGEIILPPEDDPYLQTLLASMIVHNGQDKVSVWAKKLVSNSLPVTKATAASRLKALAAGEADLTIITAGDLGLLRYPPTYEELLIGQAIDIFIPANGDFYTHVNLSSAVVPRQGDINKAVSFIEFLTSQPAQQLYAGARHEFPVNVMALPSDFIIEEMGGVREDELSLQTLLSYREQAAQIMQQAAWPTAN